jgi:hypothetical protein
VDGVRAFGASRYDVVRMPARPPRFALGLVLVAFGCAGSNRAHPPPQLDSAPARWQSKRDIDHPLVGVIVDVAAQRRVSEAELIARVQAADIVLVGETHDNPDHHRLEAALLQAFSTAHHAPAVVFEMLNREQQPAIDASLAAHPGDADALMARSSGRVSTGMQRWASRTGESRPSTRRLCRRSGSPRLCRPRFRPPSAVK